MERPAAIKGLPCTFRAARRLRAGPLRVRQGVPVDDGGQPLRSCIERMAPLHETRSRGRRGMPICVALQHEVDARHQQEPTAMRTRSAFSAVGNFLDMIGSAVAVSRAVEVSKQPRAADLRRLGIDPVSFRRIGRG
jgi:hypothetical protein